MAEKPSAGFHLIQQQAACAFAPRARIEAVTPFHGPHRHLVLVTAGDLRAIRVLVLAVVELDRAVGHPERDLGDEHARPDPDGQRGVQGQRPRCRNGRSRVADFAGRVEVDELDGLVIELTDARHGLSVDALAETTREVLFGLLEAEGASAAEALSNAGAEHWWLTLCGTRWFVLAFAPCYPADSPRFTFGSGSTFLLLQPVASFDRRAMPRGAVVADEVRQMIRRAYAAAGCPYDADLAQQDVESLKFVWPLRHGDAPLQWWQSDTGSGGEPPPMPTRHPNYHSLQEI